MVTSARLGLVVLALALFGFTSPARALPLFTGVGILPGDSESGANGVSPDGTVVVGTSNPTSGGTYHAFRWTPATGIVDLGDLPGSNDISFASAASSAGFFVVGSSQSAAGPAGEAFRWDAASGMVGLGSTPGRVTSHASDITPDGSVIVGSTSDQAFHWTSSTGMVPLGVRPDGLMTSASAVSSDGSVVVGGTQFDPGFSPYIEATILDAGGHLRARRSSRGCLREPSSGDFRGRLDGRWLQPHGRRGSAIPLDSHHRHGRAGRLPRWRRRGGRGIRGRLGHRRLRGPRRGTDRGVHLDAHPGSALTQGRPRQRLWVAGAGLDALVRQRHLRGRYDDRGTRIRAPMASRAGSP